MSRLMGYFTGRIPLIFLMTGGAHGIKSFWSSCRKVTGYAGTLSS